MPGGFQSTRRQLTEAQIDTYRKQARKTLLRGGYNLFAEIALQVIENYYAQSAEFENIQRLQGERTREVELLTHENQMLREQVTDLEEEKRQLVQQIERQQQEISRLQRGRLNIPPSWE